MALQSYRRHTAGKCLGGYKPNNRKGRNCDCPFHVEGVDGTGRFIRESMGTRISSVADAMIAQAEARGEWIKGLQAPVEIDNGRRVISVKNAVDEYIKDRQSSKHDPKLSPYTIGKDKTILYKLVDYCQRNGPAVLGEVDFATLNGFRGEWNYVRDAATNNITRLRAFFCFAKKMKWCQENPADEIKPPKQESEVKRWEFQELEMRRIHHAARTMLLDRSIKFTNHEIDTFISLMECSGMAIADASLFHVDELVGDEVRYWRVKLARYRCADTPPVVVPLPEDLVETLREMEKTLRPSGYFFCQGSTIPAVAADVWQSILSEVFKYAQIGIDLDDAETRALKPKMRERLKEPGESHRFRHTFAMRLLRAGVDIELVTKYLGHSSSKITRKHYVHEDEDITQRNSDVLRNLYRRQQGVTHAGISLAKMRRSG